MGMRSQIYIRYPVRDRKELIANYYNWNYGDRMVSRARYGIEYTIGCVEYLDWYFQDKKKVETLSRIFDTNFDMVDIQISQNIIKEREEQFHDSDFTDFVFYAPGCSDGKLFVDITKDSIKYAFTDCCIEKIFDAEQYMCNDISKDWESELDPEDVVKCRNNIKFISEYATLMTMNELMEFINYDYEAPLF